MEIIYKTGIKNDINLAEVEEILSIIFDLFIKIPLTY
jgi:hypothetical protein